ncbi:MAG: tetratricopeptide repeat protein [Symploca sp. SIO3E6]|nr:tetratricopeptide repeat protein [Caldora sp. SIO3E6]
MELKLLRLFQSNNQSNTLGGRYKIISELGAGGFGKTFVAEDQHLPGHPQCVLKQLKPQVSDAKSLQMARRLFDTEAQVLYQLGSHDQIPRLLAHFEDNQEFYLAQELIEGNLLSKELVKGKPCSEAKVINLLQDILQVLAFVHQQDVIHRDIKPSNLIRRSQDRKMVLIDFGAVKQVSTQFADPDKGQTKTISIGTQGYTPKEQLGGNPRFSSDVYAVGIIGIQALTGIHPRHFKEHPDTGEIAWRDTSEGSYAPSRSQQPAREHPSQELNSELAELLDRMVCYDFRDRYQTAAEALEALQNLSSFPKNLNNKIQTREGLSNLQLQSPASATNSNLLENDQSSTDIWEKSASSEQAATDIWEKSASSEQAATDIWEKSASSAQAATNIWQSSASSSKSSSTARSSSSGSSGELVSAEPSIPSTPTVVAQPWLGRGLFLKLGAVLTVLAAVGGTFWFTKNFSSSQTTNQANNLENTVVESENTVVESPSPKNTSSPAEESPSPSPESKSTSTSTTDKTDDKASSAPDSESTPTANTTDAKASSAPEIKPTTVNTVTDSTAPSTPKSQPTTAPTVNTAANTKAISTPKSQSTTNSTDSTVQSSPSNSPVAQPKQATPKPSAKQATPKPSTKPSPPPPSGPTAAELLKQADSLRQAENYQGALAAYDKAISSQSNVPEAHWGRCYSLNQLGRSTEAAAACDEALALKPNYPEALWSKGSTLDQQGQSQKALELYNQALKLNPNFADAWQNKGVTLYKLKRYSEAVSAFDKTIALKPNSADAWSNRGAALWALQDFDGAIASMDKAIQLDPSNQAVINLRQQVREKLGR